MARKSQNKKRGGYKYTVDVVNLEKTSGVPAAPPASVADANTVAAANEQPAAPPATPQAGGKKRKSKKSKKSKRKSKKSKRKSMKKRI